MATAAALDEYPIICDDEPVTDALEDTLILIDGGEFAIDPEDLF